MITVLACARAVTVKAGLGLVDIRNVGPGDQGDKQTRSGEFSHCRSISSCFRPRNASSQDKPAEIGHPSGAQLLSSGDRRPRTSLLVLLLIDQSIANTSHLWRSLYLIWVFYSIWTDFRGQKFPSPRTVAVIASCQFVAVPVQ